MHDLRNTHRRFPSVLFDESIRIIERPTNADHDLDPSILGEPNDLGVAIPSIRVGIFFEDEMRDSPRLEQLREERLRGFAEQKEF